MRENRGATPNNGKKTVGGGGHKPLRSAHCKRCKQPFATLSDTAECCSDECRNQFWKAEKKLGATVELLMRSYNIAARERSRLFAAVTKAAAIFFAFLEWLGFKYKAKTYCWELVR